MPADQPIIVLGHRNPDTDAVTSAIGFTALLRAQGQRTAVAGRQGVLRPETAYVLERFGVPEPRLVTDLRPRVADVMTSPAIMVHENTSLREVGRILEERNIRVVVVTDGDGRLKGVSGQADFAEALITGLELRELDQLPLDRHTLVATLGGTVVVDAPDRELRDRVMVGAMRIESMLNRLEPGILLVMGDRSDAQRAAIEFGVGAIVVTGDQPIEPDVAELARRREVMMIAVPHHTYTTLRLIQLSIPVRHVMRTDVVTCGPDDLVEDVQERLQSGPTRSLIVVDEDGTVRGIISRSNLLRPVRYRVALVDHNERGQSAVGIEEAEVLAVVDHHRVADFWTRNPPYMRLEPVGATSTIVAKLFEESGCPLPPEIAGVLLSGILADTLMFRGPTTTDEDRRLGAKLGVIAGVDAEELGTAILDLSSNLAGRPAEQILLADFKEFSVEHCRFGIGTIETVNAAAVLDRRGEFREAMERIKNRGYTSVMFAVIDLRREHTTLLVQGFPEAAAAAFEAEIHDGEIEVPRLLSRKKNIVPVLGAICRRIPRR